MIISTSHVTTVAAKAAPELAAYVADRNRSVSVSADIGASIGAAAGETTQLVPGLALTALRPPAQPPSGLDRQLQKSLLKLGKSVMADFKDTVPGAKGPVESIEFILSTCTAVKAFSAPGRKSIVGPLVGTAKAMADLVDVIDLFVPVKRNSYVQAATTVVKIGGMLYQIHADIAVDTTARPAGGTLAKPGGSGPA